QLLEQPGPTPLVAFGVRQLSADAGVDVTASHNPPADNGYKVNLGGRAVEAGGRGVQIVPPADAGIAECIAAAGPIRELPVADAGWSFLGPALSERYLETICALLDAAGP